MHINIYRKSNHRLIFILLQLLSISFASDNDDIQNNNTSTSSCTSTTTSKYTIPTLTFKRRKSHSLEEIETALISTQSQLQSAREQLSSARKDLKAAEKELAETGRTLDSFRTVITSARTARSISEPNSTPSPSINFINTCELLERPINDSEFIFYTDIEASLKNTSLIFNRKKIKIDGRSKKYRKVIDEIYMAVPHLTLQFNVDCTNNETNTYKVYTHKEKGKGKIKTTNIPCSYYERFCNNFLNLIKLIPEIIENGKIANCQFDEEKCAFKLDYTEELFFRFSARYYIYLQQLEELRTCLTQNRPYFKKIHRLERSLHYIDQCGNDILKSILHYNFKELRQKREAQRAREIAHNKITPFKKIIRFTKFKGGVLSSSDPTSTTPCPLTAIIPPTPPNTPTTPTAPSNTPMDETSG